VDVHRLPWGVSKVMRITSRRASVALESGATSLSAALSRGRHGVAVPAVADDAGSDSEGVGGMKTLADP